MFIFHKETTLEDLGNGVTRRILAHDGKMMAVEVNFEQGAIGPMHNHPHEQLTYVLSGEFEFTIGEEKHVVDVMQGGCLYCYKNGNSLIRIRWLIKRCFEFYYRCLEKRPSCFLKKTAKNH